MRSAGLITGILGAAALVVAALGGAWINSFLNAKPKPVRKTMSIDEEGFLSKEMAGYQENVKARYASHFHLLERLNRFCQRTKFTLQVNNLDQQKILAACLMIKILEDVQAAILLLERSLVSQARSLLRVAEEAVIILANICQHDWFWQAYMLAGEERRLKIFNAIKRNPSPALDVVRPELTDEIIAQIKKAAEDLQSEDVKSAPLEQWASNVGLQAVYDGTYRLLSGDVHSSPEVLNRYLVADEKGELTTFNWGPDVGKEMRGELIEAGRLLIVSMDYLDRLFQLNLKGELDQFLAELKNFNQASARKT